MKTTFNTILLLLLCLTSCFGQYNDLDYSKIRLKGLGFASEKEAILEHFGKPQQVLEPDYECGYHSAREQGKEFYQLVYKQVTFIGNETYIIDSIAFNPEDALTPEYGKHKLNQHTTTADFIRIFGEGVRDRLEKQEDGSTRLLLSSKDTEDGLMFSFRNGRLYMMEYWSPC